MTSASELASVQVVDVMIHLRDGSTYSCRVRHVMLIRAALVELPLVAICINSLWNTTGDALMLKLELTVASLYSQRWSL